MKKTIALGCGLLLLVLTGVICKALVITQAGGTWPADWPKALEPLRDHAETIGVANGIQENIYQITFSDRAEFEKSWPVILSLKTPGAPLRLYRTGASGGGIISNALPIVRIHAPSDATAVGSNGQTLKASGPWPKDLNGPKGELPQYVCEVTLDGKMAWIAGDPNKDKGAGFFYRCRVDIDLVVDGQVIDLNRIALPGDTLIEDHRF